MTGTSLLEQKYTSRQALCSSSCLVFSVTMGLFKYLGCLCIWICLYQVLATEDDKDGNEIIAHVNGAYILELGKQYNDSTLTLLGIIFKNFERNISIIKQQTRIEYFLHKLCESRECDDWPEWPECPAPISHFGVVTRSRDCGRNTSKCTYPAYKERTETETTVCVGREEYTLDEDEDEQDTEKTHCPNHFQLIQGYCLLLDADYTSQASAKTMCEVFFNGVLVNIDTVKKMEAVYSLLDQGSASGNGIWIDGIKPNSSAPVRYRNDVKPDFNNWSFGQPADDAFDIKTGQFVDYLCKVDTGSNPRSWMVDSCDNEYQVVCEYV